MTSVEVPIEQPAAFVAKGAEADCAVVIVTYNSADHIDELIADLRRDAGALKLRVVVADNGSKDSTKAVVTRHEDVVFLPTGGNLGYAGGINQALEFANNATTVAILNPDVRLDAGAMADLIAATHEAGCGIAVPRMLDDDGVVSMSLRREPSIVRAFVYALSLHRVNSRFAQLSETVWDPTAYDTEHDVDWATGSVYVMSSDCAEQVGLWDERFFLYSEETDAARRARDAGFTVRYRPTAIVRHAGGASGASDQLRALMAVNRVRYFEKFHGHVATAVFRVVVVLHQVLRVKRDPYVLKTLVRRKRWNSLPKASRP